MIYRDFVHRSPVAVERWLSDMESDGWRCVYVFEVAGYVCATVRRRVRA